MAIVRALTTNSLCGAATELYAAFEQATGHRVEARYDPAKAILRDIAAGARAEVVLLGSASIEDLRAQGLLDEASVRPIAQSGVGIGVREGSPLPDVSTPEAFLATLRAVPSIAHTTEGASGLYFGQLLAALGLAEELRPKIRTRPGGLVGEVLVAGEAFLGIQQVSELMAVPGVVLAGTLPSPWQRMFGNSGALFREAARDEAARVLLDWMSTSQAAAVYRRRGLEPTFG